MTWGATPAPSQAMGQTSAGVSSRSIRTNFPARGTSHQGRGLRGRPTIHARLHVMTQHEGCTSPEVIIGTLLIVGQPAFTLIDLGATHSFMSNRFALHANVPSSPLPNEWYVSLPSGDILIIEWVFRCCGVSVEGYILEAVVDCLRNGMDFL